MFARELEDLGEEHILHAFVREAVLHELDECWLVDGQRVRDPHSLDVTKYTRVPA